MFSREGKLVEEQSTRIQKHGELKLKSTLKNAPNETFDWFDLAFQVLYIIYEHASGYGIFKVVAQEEIGVLLPEVQEAQTDLARFGKLVKLVAFMPFKSAANALDNINCVSEGKNCCFICLCLYL